MVEENGGDDDFRSSPHFLGLCKILLLTLTRPERNILVPTLSVTRDDTEVGKAIEDAATQILRFFSEADSADPLWQYRDETTAEEDSKPFKFSGAYRFNMDDEEAKATESARRGRTNDLEELILNRGYLRTREARQVIVSVFRGERVRKGASEQQKRVFEDISELMLKQLCSETKAQAIFIEERNKFGGNEISEHTLRDQWKAAKRDKVLATHLALYEHFIDQQRERMGLRAIPSRRPRGIEKFSGGTLESWWVEK